MQANLGRSPMELVARTRGRGAAVVVLALLALSMVVLSPTPARAEPKYISTLAGSGVIGYNGEGLPPLSTAFYLPQDGVFGPDGNYYFSDWNNHRIRRIRNDVVEDVAGTGEIGDAPDGPALGIKLNHPTHISFDLQGRMILSAWHNSKVKRIDLSTGMATNIIGTGARAYGGDGGAPNAARLDLPSSAVVDSQGNVILSDQANFRIRRMLADGSLIETIAGTGVAGYTGDNGPATAATIRSPVGQSAPPAGRLDLDSLDRIYIADTGNHVIRRIETDGTIVTIAGNGTPGYTGDGGLATQATLNTPSDVAVAPDGSFYIADTKNNVIRRVDTDGVITTFAGTGGSGYSGDGNLAINAKLNRPYGVAVGPAGQVVIADTHNHRLRVVTEERIQNGPGGEEPEIEIVPCTNVIGSICTYAGTGFPGLNGDGKDRQKTHLYQPIDMEFCPSGRVYVLDWNNHKVRQLMPDQTFRTVMGTDFVGDGPPDLSDLSAPGAPGLTIDLNHPTDMQEFPDGQLMVMNWHNHKIRVLDPPTGLVRVIAGRLPGFLGDGGPAKDMRANQPSHAVLDPNGNLIFIDQRSQRIRIIRDFAAQRENGIVSTLAGDPGVPPPGALPAPGFNGDGPALTRQFAFPTGTNPEPSGGIARTAEGVFYFSDTNNHRIRKLEFLGPDFTDGVVTTVVGNGTPANGPDGVLGTETSINYPQDMEIGPDGKLYFADANNHRVRRLDLTTGIVEAVAGTGVEGYSGDGGPAVDATFHRPFGIAFDPFGNLYISDTFNSRIRKVKLTDTAEGPEPVLPEDYRSNFVEVRDCRFSLEHGGVYIRVLASPDAVDAYNANANPLPVGSVIVKEEFIDDHCEIDELVRWRVMRKEAPGFDPEQGDWHWQYMTPRREVFENDKSSCIGCHVQPDCVLRDYMCTLPGGGTELRTVLDNLPGTLVSVSGTQPEDGHAHGHSINFNVYAVGSDPGDGRGPMVVTYDGDKWQRLNTGQSGDLWWITDRQIGDDFYLAGENGMILRLTHEHDVEPVITRMTTPGGKLLFGVWGTSQENLWACGGDLNDEDLGGVVWKYNGTEWVNDPTIIDARPEGIPTLYKVWGTGPTDVYAVGRRGVVLHYNGVRWTSIPTNVVRPLFTIHGNGQTVATVGGAFEGVLLELEGGSFIDRTPIDMPQINGVYISEGPAAAVGAEGSWATRGPDGWVLKTAATAARPFDFHGAWMDAAGGVWAVGGDLTVDQSYGVLAFAGSATIGQEFEADPCPTGVTGQALTVSYARDIAPIFRKNNCFNSECHTGPAPASEYSQLYDNMFGPGEIARNLGMCDIVPGNPGASLLMDKIGPNPRVGARMPDTFPPLLDSEIQLISTWIAEGAIKDTPPQFNRGDVNVDGGTNISDAITTLGYLFGGDPSTLLCTATADVNDDSIVNISDPISLLGYLFLGSPTGLPEPFGGCGVDLTVDDLGCATYNKCE